MTSQIPKSNIAYMKELKLSFDGLGAEMGFFFFLSLLGVFFIVDRLHGKPFRLKIFLLNRKYDLLEGKPQLINIAQKFLTAMTMFSLAFPLIALVVWVVALLIKAKEMRETKAGGICVALAGPCIFFFLVTFYKLKWNNYQFDFKQGIDFGMIFALLTCFQFVAVFLPTGETIFGLGAVFLSANCLVMMIIVFINSAVKKGSIEDLIEEVIPEGGQPPKDPLRALDFQEEIKKERDDKTYFPSKHDILDLFTINKPQFRSKYVATAYGPGIQNFFAVLPDRTKQIITLILWCVATAILIVYSYMVKRYFPATSRVGFITMIAILTTDVLLFFIHNAEIVRTATPLAFTLFINRFFLIIFGGDYWIYGYILIYVFYALFLCFIIAKRKFSIEDDTKNFNIDNFFNEQKAKAASLKGTPQAAAGGNGMINQKLAALENKVDAIKDKINARFKLLTEPEHPLIIITIIYVIIFIILAVVKPNGIPLPYLLVNSRQLHFFTAWAFALILICGFFTSMVVIRLFIRKKSGNTLKVYYEFQGHCGMKQFRIDRYWFFLTWNCCCLVAIGILAWYVTGSWAACIIIIFVDFYILCILNFYTHFISNDYEFLQNIDTVNIRVRQFNSKSETLKKEIAAIKTKLLAGSDPTQVSDREMMDRALKMFSSGDAPKASPVPANNKIAPTASGNNWNIQGSNNNQKPQPSIAKVNINVKPDPVIVPPSKPAPPPPEEDKIIEEEIKRMDTQNQKNIQQPQIQPQIPQQPPQVAPTTNNNQQDPSQISAAAQNKNKKKHQNSDGIYEGGEAENLELTEIVVDPDDEEVVDTKKVRVKYKEVEDWRKQFNFFQAFWKGALRKNDYNIILSQLIGLIVLVIGAWLVCRATSSYIGITIFVPFAHYTLAAFSHMKTLNTDAPMSIYEYVCFFLAYVIQYGWGIANLFITYNQQKKKVLVNGVLVQTKALDAGLYIVVNLIVIPFITSLVAAILKWYDTKGKITPFLIVQLAITLVQGIAMLICAFIFMTWVQGVIVSAVIGVISYIAFQVWLYHSKYDHYLPRFWVLINVGIGIFAIVAAFVASFFVPTFSIFMGFSISVWLVAFILFVYGAGRTGIDYWQRHQRPVFFSPWVFPIYKYDPKKQDVFSHNFPALCLIGAFSMIIGWAFLATVWITPTNVGVAVSISCEVFLLLVIIFLIQVSHLQLKKLRDSAAVDQKIIRRAWLEAKSAYVSNKNASSRAELVSFEEYMMRRDLFRNKIRLTEGRSSLSLEEKMEGVQLLQSVSDQQVSGWLNSNVVNLNDQLSCYQYLFEIEKEISQSYRQELELIVMFQLLIIAYSEIYAEQKKKFLFTFLIERRSVLLALDIVINIPANSPPNVQFAKVIAQIQDLPPEKQAFFTELRDSYINDQRALDEKRREQANIEEQKSQERQQNVQDIKKRKRDGMKDNQGKPIEQWEDCLEKYYKILEQVKTTGQKFSDPQFKPDDSSLGPRATNRGVEQWIRASEFPNKKCVLYKDTVSCLDVVQGALGDCYYLSAISVLGEKNVKDMIKTTEADWTKTGCFCVRFYRDGEEEYVIVDDYFPARKVEGKMAWVFTQGGDDGDELWSMVLEKAYAKFYGSFQNIEAGKIQYALADMIQGFPEQLDLKQDGKNLDVFWEKIKSLKSSGALMGAGSPENPQGDAAINQLGIVQGHAYSVLDVQELDDAKLIKLRNPHGKNGAEWSGDWCDTDANWNQRAKSKLNYQPRDHEDGVFWMDAYDFLQQYSYLYICRILSASQGWKQSNIEGAWKGPSAEGLPSRANPSAKLELNPQYSITISKPCNGFIKLVQKNSDPNFDSTFKGKLNIFFMVSKNNGKLITKVDKDAILTRSGNPINLNIISSECEFDKSVNYPYTFTLLVANTAHGAEGEGQFEVSIYSTDATMDVKPLN